ncbi:MAG: CHAT domain-containing protein, partial [Longimicrobiales bacterium]
LQELQTEGRFQAILTVSPEVLTLPGRQRRPRFDEDRWWNRIEVCENAEDGSLEFRNLTQKRARSEEYLQATQKQLIDGFVRDAISSPNPDPATASTLFELLVPNTLKEYAPEQHDLVLILDEASARYPWELMQDRRAGAGAPIAVRSGLVRTLSVDTFRDRPQAVLGNHALVVGDPPSELPPLPGAVAEAQAVAELLAREGLSVTPLIQPPPRTVVTQLFARDYKIMHFAAHGLHDHEIVVREARTPDEKPLKKRVSGMVIGPQYVLLTPAEVRQVRAVPELVFINCCHLGRTDVERSPDVEQDPLRMEAEQQRLRHRLAANLAAEFIRMGVRAVIAAGWAVDDGAAVTFATSFYRQMLKGKPFGDAVRRARQDAYEQHPGVNTWGAYQCYGDPGYMLRLPTDAYDEEPREEGFATRDELVLTLENITQSAETIAHRDTGEEQARIARIHKWVRDRRPSWLKDARVQSAFARVYRELDQFAEAIACYREANGASKAHVEIVDLEQLANLESRIASINYIRSGHDSAARTRAAKAIEASIQRLDRLPPGPVSAYVAGDEQFTSERLALYASAHKRLCLVTEGRDWLEALHRMKEFYGYADLRADRCDNYPALNWLFACALLHVIGAPDTPPNWAEEVGRIRALATRADEAQADFWSLAAHAEADLAVHMAMTSLPDAVDEVVDGYRRAWQRGGTPRKMRSVLENLDWLVDSLNRPPVPAKRPAKTGAGGATNGRSRKRAANRRRQTEAMREIRRQVGAWI